MTAQASEILLLDGRFERRRSLPLDPYLEPRGIDLRAVKGYHAGLYRGYVGIWEVVASHGQRPAPSFADFPAALEFDLGPYDERPSDAASWRDALFKRPAMLLGNMENGDAFAGIVRQLVEASLSWRIGANLGLRLTPGNGVELVCYSGLPQGGQAHEHHWSRPIDVVTDQWAILGRGSFALRILALACSRMKWEIRDRFGAGSADFDQGLCRRAARSAPDLPGHLCLRVVLVIGTPRLAITPATMDRVVTAIRCLSGPAQAGYWGCVSISDTRTGEARAVVVTDPLPTRV